MLAMSYSASLQGADGVVRERHENKIEDARYGKEDRLASGAFEGRGVLETD